jgi:ferredoxin
MSGLVQIKNGKSKTPWYRRPKVIRNAVMAFFSLFLLDVAYTHQLLGGGPKGSPSVEAYCPLGGLEGLYLFVTTGGFIRRIQPSTMVVFGAVLLMTLVFSRGFCGWVCPFGSLQEWLGILGRRVFGKQFNPTGRWEKRLRSLRYVLLVVIIGFTWCLGTLVFRPYDPFLAFFHLGRGVDEMPWAYAALGAVVLGSLRYERFFCKYACPMGAVIGILGKFSLTKIVRDGNDCKECNVCQKQCWAHVDFLSSKTINDSSCNHCLDCLEACPRPSVLSLKGVQWRIPQPVYATVLVAGLFMVVGATKLTGYWQTKESMVSFRNGRGELEAEQIRGWMTLNDISNGYGVPLAELYRRAHLPERVGADTRLNLIAKTYKVEFEPEQMREAVKGFLQKAPPAQKKSEGKDHKSGGEQQVRGNMTLNEIAMKTGVPKDYILKALGSPKGVNPQAPMRDWIHSAGKTMQDVREAVEAYKKAKK